MTPVLIDKKERTRHAPLNGAKTSRSRDADDESECGDTRRLHSLDAADLRLRQLLFLAQFLLIRCSSQVH